MDYTHQLDAFSDAILIDMQAELPPPPKTEEKGTTEKQKKARKKNRNERYRLQAVAGRLLSGRVEACGHRRHNSSVDIFRTMDKSKAAFHGVVTCGSIWSCPVCAGKISAERSNEVQALAEKHQEAIYSKPDIPKLENGWREPCMFMATLTLRHHVRQPCRDLKKTLTIAWQKYQQGAPWKRIKESFGIIGIVRSIEVTHGKNGWHPHLHLLIFTERTLSVIEQDALQQKMFSRWIDKIEALDGTCDTSGLDFREARGKSGAAEYIAKWGAGCEVAKGEDKKGKRGSRSPWQLLRAYEGGDKQAGKLFADYAKAFKGTRHLTYTKAIRERYGLRDRLDEELAAKMDLEDAQPQHLMTITEGAWADICAVTKGQIEQKTNQKGACFRAMILSVAEDGGKEAVCSLLDMFGIDPDQEKRSSMMNVPKNLRPDGKRVFLGNQKQRGRDAYRGFNKLYEQRPWQSRMNAPDFDARPIG